MGPRDRGPADRRRALDRAARAERAVAQYLQAHGYVIVGQNVRLGRLELDVVARCQRTIVVVEVRTRSPSAYTSGFGSIDAAKRERIRKAAERLWRQHYERDGSVDHLRFDAASVVFEHGVPRVSYCRAAF